MQHYNAEHFKKLLSSPLPGEEAQMKMAPPYRGRFTKEEIEQFNPKIAAVLVLLYRKNGEWHLVFTERMQYPGPAGRRVQAQNVTV